MTAKSRVFPKDGSLRRHLAFLTMMSAIGGALPAPPASAASTRFNDWELVCPDEVGGSHVSDGALASEGAPGEPPASGGVEAVRSCRLQQAHAVAGGGEVVFLFNVVMQKGRPIAIISTPLNVYLPAGLELAIDGGAKRRAVFETCAVTGCHAGFALEETLLNGLRRGNVLTVSMKDSKATTVTVNVLLKGFTAGMKALADYK